jgi:hypothetical protein
MEGWKNGKRWSGKIRGPASPPLSQMTPCLKPSLSFQPLSNLCGPPQAFHRKQTPGPDMEEGQRLGILPALPFRSTKRFLHYSRHCHCGRQLQLQLGPTKLDKG